MFRWVHLIDLICKLIHRICRSICAVFGCSDHVKEENKNE